MSPNFESIQTEYAKIQNGDWFLPMTIKEVNQHSLIEHLAGKKAAGFTVQDGEAFKNPENLNHFKVPDLRKYLFDLAVQKRALLKTEIAVVTGSTGKTSVKEIFGAILRQACGDHSFTSPANQNTKIALATQILRLPQTTQKAVFEMGARKVGDFQVPLSYLQPQVVVALNVGTAHVGEFGSLENLRQEKMSVLRAPGARVLVVYGDDPLMLQAAQQAAAGTMKKILSFGYGENNSIRILEETPQTLKLDVAGFHLDLVCSFAGSAKALNIAASVGMSLALGISFADIQKAISNFQGIARRFQSFSWGNVLGIDDAFNASPESMALGLQTLAGLYPTKKILLVLGSMLELGEHTEKAHRNVGQQVAQMAKANSNGHGLLSLVTVGDEAMEIANSARSFAGDDLTVKNFANSSDAKEFLKIYKDEFEVVYFKGSKSIALHKIFEVTP